MALALAFISTIILFFAVGFFLPAKWTVERTIVINATPAQIYPLVSDFKTGWSQWSAFDFEDPTIQYSYSGPSEGVGAERSWTSKKMGDGSQRMLMANPQIGVVFELVMKQNPIPISGRISFETIGNTTKVTWHDEGDMGNNIPLRYLGRFMNNMMGKNFETSLNTLKQKAENTKN